MNSPELNSTSQPQAAGNQDLQKQIDGLQKLFAVALVLMLMVGGSLAGYLYGQNRVVKTSLRETETFIKDYNERSVPKLKELQAALQNYSTTHADLVPILQKYGMAKAPASPTANRK
jgi:hypothetical protein